MASNNCILFSYVKGNNFGDLVASCPNLKILKLFRVISFDNINIHSAKLKILAVDGQFNHLNLYTPYLTSALINMRHLTGDASKARCNFNFSQFIASLLDVEKILLCGPILEVRVCDRLVFIGACYFTVWYYVYGPLASLQCAEHEFLVLKPAKLFNRLTKIGLDIDLGNPKEANLSLCLFQHAPNLQIINLKVI